MAIRVEKPQSSGQSSGSKLVNAEAQVCAQPGFRRAGSREGRYRKASLPFDGFYLKYLAILSHGGRKAEMPRKSTGKQSGTAGSLMLLWGQKLEFGN